jgi:hypothetical protein
MEGLPNKPTKVDNAAPGVDHGDDVHLFARPFSGLGLGQCEQEFLEAGCSWFNGHGQVDKKELHT